VTELGSSFEVTIEKMATGGSGLARHGGLVVFVPFAAPGDRVLVRVTKIKKNFIEAEIQNILESGPARVKPPCPVFGRCGGCNWQHLAYPEQLRQKENILWEHLRSALPGQDFARLPILPSPQEFRYRNRIQLHVEGSKRGFFARQSHEIVPIQDCPITEEPLAAYISSNWTAPESRVELMLDANLRPTLATPGAFGFSQVNRFQNEHLVRTVTDWVKGSAGTSLSSTYEKVYDLYAGAGNFSIPLYQMDSRLRIEAVELSDGAVRSGVEKLRAAKINLHHFRFYVATVEGFLKRQSPTSKSLVILDPPRVGCHELVMKALAASRPSRLIYVSCNHTTFSRDVQRHLALDSQGKSPYRLTRIQPVDMFPQTDHIELVAELARTTES
jgi:23S rRNA (uracil1939-C5)-methyltransferase